MRLAVVAALLLSTSAFAQDAGAPAAVAAAAVAPIDVTQIVAPQKVKLGEPFTRTITLTHPRAQRYELALPSDWGEFELLEQQRRRSDSGQQATTTFALQLSAFELGKRTLPALTFEIASPDGASRWTSPTAEVEVETSLPDDAQQQGANLYDIRPPEEVPVPSYRLLWALLIAAATAVLAYLLFRWWKRRREQAALIPAGPPLPPEERARQALAELTRENLPAQGRIKEFYFRLTDIARAYLGARYGVEALECTSSELMERLRTVPAPALPREEVAKFLSEADLVKFARAQMTPDDCARSLDFAHHMVEITTAKPAPPDAAERKLP